jgi:hypothetical protein
VEEKIAQSEIRGKVRYDDNQRVDFWASQFDHYRQKPQPPGYLVFEHMTARGTWPFPPVIIDNMAGFADSLSELSPGRPSVQRRGIGRALVADLEVQVRQRGALTILLGSDDETTMTTLSGVDLYPDVWPHIRSIRNLRGHPFEFYQKCGFVIVGVVPDANGFGKPDILMAKRVADS